MCSARCSMNHAFMSCRTDMASRGVYNRYSIWEHSSRVAELYRRRCRLEDPEMDSAKQAAAILGEFARSGETIFDAGCGSGYFYHSVRSLGLSYCGVDASPRLIGIGREEMPSFGLDPSKLLCARIEDIEFSCDHAVCLNVLSNIDNYHRPLDRLLSGARRSVILRESAWDQPAKYSYVIDHYLDKGHELRVHVNTYCINEILEFGRQRGFHAEHRVDERTSGQPEMVIDHPHYWSFFVFRRGS